jgi:hypothetical protein
LPSSRKGGESLKLSVRNPMAVVRDVRKTGCPLTIIASTMASSFSIPSRRSWK